MTREDPGGERGPQGWTNCRGGPVRPRSPITRMSPEVRGRGLLIGVEIVKGPRHARALSERMPASTSRVVNAALERGVFFYGGGTGEVRDVIVLGPPFIIDGNHVEQMVQRALGSHRREVTQAA